MDNRNRQSIPPAEGPAEPDMEKENEQRLPPAGRISTLLFLAVGLVFFVQSLQLFWEDPSPSGYGIFPLLVSGLLLILTVVDYIQKLKIKSELDGLPMKEKVTITIKYLFPVNSVVFLFMSIGFYIAITLGVPFMVAATVFLMISMCYLIPHAFVKNLIYTVVIMVTIYVIFSVLFKVTLP